jgi:plastocyanin
MRLDITKLPVDWLVTAILAVAVAATFFTAFRLTVSEGGEEAAGPAPATTPAPGGTVVEIRAIPTLKFDRDTLEIPANVDVTIRFINEDTGVPHNVAAYKTKEAKEALAVGELCTAPCENTITVNVPPGKYFFRCDIHPVQMKGDLVAR